MPNRMILGLTFLVTGVVLLVVAYGRAGAIPEELYGQIGTPRQPRGPTEWVLQARFLQSAYLAAGGMCFVVVGGVGVVTAARGAAGAAEL